MNIFFLKIRRFFLTENTVVNKFKKTSYSQSGGCIVKFIFDCYRYFKTNIFRCRASSYYISNTALFYESGSIE
jgi:hypothetical protein